MLRRHPIVGPRRRRPGRRADRSRVRHADRRVDRHPPDRQLVLGDPAFRDRPDVPLRWRLLSHRPAAVGAGVRRPPDADLERDRVVPRPRARRARRGRPASCTCSCWSASWSPGAWPPRSPSIGGCVRDRGVAPTAAAHRPVGAARHPSSATDDGAQPLRVQTRLDGARRADSSSRCSTCCRSGSVSLRSSATSRPAACWCPTINSSRPA